jgi:hypothetical protein
VSVTRDLLFEKDRPTVLVGRSFLCFVVAALATCGWLPPAQETLKVIVDQDARGPGTSDQQAILVFLQSQRLEVLGVTTVSGDQWVKEETQHTLRMLEIAERTEVPVIQGAEFPLLNSKEETKRWETLYGNPTPAAAWLGSMKLRWVPSPRIEDVR